MIYKIAKIFPRPFSRFHFGQMKMDHNLSLSDSDPFCRSDTLFSGLVNSYAKVRDEEAVKKFVEGFETGNIKISSLFYFIDEDGKEPIYLLPKPAFLALHVDRKNGHYKKLGKIEFVSKKVWELGLKIGDWLDESRYRILQNKIIVTADEYRDYGLSEKDRLYDLESTPKSPHTGNKNESIFYQTDVILHTIRNTKSGLYFIYECDSSLERELKNAINILAFSGFGGETGLIGRTVESVSVTDNVIEFADANYFSNVSLYSPCSMDEFENCKYYETVLRGGRRKSHDSHSQVIRMIEEGALFGTNRIKGRAISLGLHESNEHNILRNGIPLLIPIRYEHQ